MYIFLLETGLHLPITLKKNSFNQTNMNNITVYFPLNTVLNLIVFTTYETLSKNYPPKNDRQSRAKNTP